MTKLTLDYFEGCPPDRSSCFCGGDPSGKDCPNVKACFQTNKPKAISEVEKK